MTDFKIERLAFDADHVSAWHVHDPAHDNWPVVYLLTSENEIYVGETGNAASRMQQHLAAPERRHLEGVRVILNRTFNKSACLDLESHLIRYFSADGRFRVLNGNWGISDSDYYQRSEYRKGFEALFDELQDLGFLTRPIPELVNSNLFKYSPFKALTTDQSVAIATLLDALFEDMTRRAGSDSVVQGDPGTGKTIVAIYLLKLLRDIATQPSDEVVSHDSAFSEFFTDRNKAHLARFRIGLVIPQQSLRETIRKVFARTPGLDEEMVIDQFEVGMSKQPWDLLIVDEAHRLGLRANQASAAQNKRFKEINERLFRKDDLGLTQLDWIRKQSKHRVLLIDADQSIRPADLPRGQIDAVSSEANDRKRLVRLTSQMRVNGGNDYIRFASNLLSGTPEIARDFGEYDLQFFDDFSEMWAAIRKRDSEHGLSRLLAGFAWKWVSKRDRKRHDIQIDGVKLFWNRTATDWVNSPTSAEEVGSIHTIQGYDLNFAGVIIGTDLGYDPARGTVVFRRGNYFDIRGKQDNKQLGIEFSDDDLRQYVVNIYRVLLTRGIKGTYIYVVDKELRKHLRQFFPVEMITR
jgi:DUF2075 family protein